MKLRTRITLLVAPAIIAGGLIAGPAGSQPFEGPDDIQTCPVHVDCGPDDPDPEGPGDKVATPVDPPQCDLVLTLDGDWKYVGEDCDNEVQPPVDDDPDPETGPDLETPEVPEAQPEAPRPGKPNFTG